MNAWEKMRRACIIGALLWHDVSWSWAEGVWVCWCGWVAVARFSWSYKAEGGQSCLGSITCLLSSHQLLPIPVMSLINNRTFERSMGHHISRQDACFHLHTSDGQHYPSNQQVRHRQDSALMSLIGVLIVGGLGANAWQLVPPLGSWGDAWWPALAPSSSNGSHP